MNRIAIAVLSVSIAACQAIIPAPSRLPSLNERAITGAGVHMLPQWSPDGQFVAFIAGATGDRKLTVVEVSTRQSWVAASEISTRYFDWTADGKLAYIKYRPELSGLPCPAVNELHIVERNGNNDQVIVSNLYDPGAFAFFGDSQKLVMTLSTASTQCDYSDIYAVDIATGHTQLLVSRQELGISNFSSISLSPDKSTLAIYAVLIGEYDPDVYTTNETSIILYDLNAKAVIKKVIPSQDIPDFITDPKLPPAGLSGEHMTWTQDQRWLVDKGYAAEGKCYNYNLIFLNIDDPGSSFCIPSIEGIIAEPALSPDMSKIAYITVVGPGVDYIMLADITTEYQVLLADK